MFNIKIYEIIMESDFRIFKALSQRLKDRRDGDERRKRFEPLEVMRGATFHNSYMILDEAQNCTL